MKLTYEKLKEIAALFAITLLLISLTAPTIAFAETGSAITDSETQFKNAEVDTGAKTEAQITQEDANKPDGTFSKFNCGVTHLDNCIAYMMYETMTLFAWLLGVVALLFTATIYYTVLHLGTLVNGDGSGNGLTSIVTAWGILRSLANIALLFTFVLIGIATILDIEEYGVKRLLPKLLIAAILLNFSLFLTRAIIDVGDTFAVQFYKELNGGQTSLSQFDIAHEPISEAFMEATNLRSIYNPADPKNNKPAFGLSSDAASFASTVIIISFLGIILFIIAAFVFLALTIMFIARVITLIFLMILSPIGFISSAIPGLGDRGRQWWRTLMNNVLFAPVVLLCILISISMLQHGLANALGAGLGQAPGQVVNSQTSLLSGVAKDPSDTASYAQWADILLVFTLAAGFLFASLVIAKQLSMMGANFAVSASRKIVSAPFNALGAGAMRGVGVGARFAGNWYNAKSGQWAQKDGVRLLASRLGRFTGLDQAVSRGLKKAQEVKVGGYASYAESREAKLKYATETSHAAEKKDVTDALANLAQNPKDDELKSEVQKLTQRLNLHSLEEVIKSCNDAQLAALSTALSPDKFEKVLDSKEVSTQAEKMGHMRYHDVDAEKAKTMSNKDLELMARADSAKFREVVGDLKEDQKETLGNNERLTAEQRQLAKGSTITGRVKILLEKKTREADDQAYTLILENHMSPEKKAELSRDELFHQGVMDTIDQEDIQALITKKKLTGQDLKQLLDYLRSATPRDDGHRERIEAIENLIQESEFVRGATGQKK